MAVFDNGKAPKTESAMIDEAKVPRSSFNMSRVTSFNGLFGALMPFDVLDTLPNEDYTIGYDVLALTRNPLMRRLQNSGTIYIHTFWMPKRDLWKGWDNFIDKGRSGTHVSSVPKYYPAYKINENPVIDHQEDDLTTLTPFSPACYMGVPIVCYDNKMTNLNYAYLPCGNGQNKENVVNNGYGTDINNTEKWGISALDLVMYNRIYRDEYANQNILMNNKYWFPDNEDDALILPYSLPANQKGYCNRSDGFLDYKLVPNNNNNPLLDGESGVYIPDGTEESKYIPAQLNALHFRQFKGDYFTSANPFKDLIRGNSDTLQMDMEFNIEHHLNQEVWKDFQPDKLQDGSFARYASIGMLVDNNMDGSPETFGFTQINETGKPTYLNDSIMWNQKAKNLLEKMYKSVVSTKKGLTLNTIRKAIVLEKFMQRNATTNGTYKELVGAQFGYKPNVHDRRPRYVGGCYQSLNFSEVVQTSSTNGTDMLGKTASRGMSANSGYIGKFHSDDYGTLMSIMCIVPDVYYDNQGLEKRFTRTEQEEQYFPIYNNLEPQAILNKELYVSGDKTYDEDVLAYANRYEDMKSRRNIICGLGACGEKAVYDSQNFMRRTFNNESKPQFTQKFLTMSPANIDLKPFASVNEPPFDIIVGCNIDKVSPMPYKAEPADLGIAY